VSTISPENLLDLADYHFYANSLTNSTTKQQNTKDSPLENLTNGFEMKSRKAWTDLLLQVAKVTIFIYFMKYKPIFFLDVQVGQNS